MLLGANLAPQFIGGLPAAGGVVLNIEILVIVICFGFRYSNFDKMEGVVCLRNPQ